MSRQRPVPPTFAEVGTVLAAQQPVMAGHRELSRTPKENKSSYIKQGRKIIKDEERKEKEKKNEKEI